MILIRFMILLTGINSASAQNLNTKFAIPSCPQGSQKVYTPDAVKPLWIGCKDKKGLYQGFLVQFSVQGEILRIAALKNSQRNGKEIRFGESGFLEERSYLNGHLTQDSFIYHAETVLSRLLPKVMTLKDWQAFDDVSGPSILGNWLKKEPFSVVHFENGRMNRVRFEKKDYTFTISPEGRIFSNNHPDMKGNMFFIDPMPMWNLSSDDMKRVLLPGFGSCKKYSGPISRFYRHYDHLLYVRQPSEVKHLTNLIEIRRRFINFCVPTDLMEHLGALECPPQLPEMLSPNHCLIPISDQIKIPYEPKYFKFEYSFGKSPEDFVKLFGADIVLAFVTDPDRNFISKFIPPKTLIVVKKSQKKLLYRVYLEHPRSQMQGKDLEDTEWWEWHPFPGSE